MYIYIYVQQPTEWDRHCLSPFSKLRKIDYNQRSFTAHFLSIIGCVLSEREQREVQSKTFTAQSIQNLFFFTQRNFDKSLASSAPFT
ncbi:Alanine--tRNA ligase [Bienertia sinuspersici]